MLSPPNQERPGPPFWKRPIQHSGMNAEHIGGFSGAGFLCDKPLGERDLIGRQFRWTTEADATLFGRNAARTRLS